MMKKGLTQKKNDASFHALSSGETQASFPASFKQVADHHSATLIFVETDF